MHLCVVCRKNIEDKLGVHYLAGRRVGTLYRYYTMDNPICGECLEEGWTLRTNKQLIIMSSLRIIENGGDDR